jgi:transcriptional regulator with XRE-family HTH domain
MHAALEYPLHLSADRIKAAMQKRGWAEKDLAYHAKLSLPAVQQILSGVSGGRVSSLTKIAQALGLRAKDIAQLFED